MLPPLSGEWIGRVVIDFDQLRETAARTCRNRWGACYGFPSCPPALAKSYSLCCDPNWPDISELNATSYADEVISHRAKRQHVKSEDQ